MEGAPPPLADDEVDDGTTGFAAFRYRDYRIFFFGKFFSVASYHMIMIAVGYQIYDLTGSALSLAMINVTMIAPVLGLALFAGFAADMFDRRKVLLWCYVVLMVSAVMMSVVTSLHLTVIWPFYAVLLFVGIGRAFFGPTSNSFVPNLVTLDVFPNAVAWNSSSARMAQICGPAAGGFLYLLGPHVVYLTAAFTFLCGALTTSMIKPREASMKGSEPSIRSVFDGLFYIFKKRILLGAIIVDLMTALMSGVTALLPIFAKDILDVGAAGAGILRSSMAIGGLTAGLALTRIPIRRKAGTIMLTGAAVYGLSTAAFGLSTSFAFSVVALAVVGASEVINANVRQTLMQIATPDSLRGRVGAVSSISSSIGTEMGGFRAGSFAAIMGAVPAVVVGGLIVVATAAACPKIFPELARVERMDRSL